MLNISIGPSIIVELLSNLNIDTVILLVSKLYQAKGDKIK